MLRSSGFHSVYLRRFNQRKQYDETKNDYLCKIFKNKYKPSPKRT
jgi:hypothetical protein